MTENILFNIILILFPGVKTTEDFFSIILGQVTPDEVSTAISFFGVSAMVSVTFMTLLFAIATINYSFRYKENEDTYHLKILIKRDLVTAVLKTVLPQLALMLILFITGFIFSRLLLTIVMLGIFLLQICTLWQSANTVYYFILQNDANSRLKPLLEYNCAYFGIINYPPGRYDVYSIKKTLYPKLHKKLYKTIKGTVFSKLLKIFSCKKEKLDKIKWVAMWEYGFDNEIDDIVKQIMNENIHENQPLFKYLDKDNKKSDKKVKYNNKILKDMKILKPKVQAPDRITEICLDKMYKKDTRIQVYTDRGESIQILTGIELSDLIYYFLLLYSCKKYAESRQDEKKRSNVFKNRAKYTNSNDTYMYTLYGNILYHIGKKVKPEIKIKYFEEAVKAYECAEIVNQHNQVAAHNKEIINGLILRITESNIN